MKTVPLKAARRTLTGKQKVKQLRVKGEIPAIVYGRGMQTESIQVPAEEFLRVIHTKAGENVIIKLEVTGQGAFEKTVMIKDIQHHAVTDRIQHVDFNAISMTEKIQMKVPVHVTGESRGVKEEGGILDVVHHEIEVECLPTDIPEKLTIDISALEIGKAVHIREISFPKGVKPLLEEDEVVVSIHAPKAEVEPTEEAATQPEVIGKKKEEGEEGEGAAEAPAPKAAKEGKEGKE